MRVDLSQRRWVLPEELENLQPTPEMQALLEKAHKRLSDRIEEEFKRLFGLPLEGGLATGPGGTTFSLGSFHSGGIVDVSVRRCKCPGVICRCTLLS